MPNLTQIARRQRRTSRSKPFVFKGFKHGLNTSVPPFQIAPTELADGTLNYKINKGGQLENRLPINTFTTTAASGSAAIKFLAKIPIGTTDYELLVDSGSACFYISGTTPIGIRTLEGEATITPYKSIGLICDGSYLKYINGVTSSGVKICYDDGTGTSGYQFDNRAGTSGSTMNLSLSSGTGAAYKFTSQSWTVPYTIPPTTLTASLKKSAVDPSGTTVFARIRSTVDSSILASGTLTTVSALSSGAAATFTCTFTSSDVTTEMSGSTAYYAAVEFSGGSATTYVTLSATTVTSGGTAYHNSGSWYAVATKTPIMSLRPGRPPKGKFATIYKNRPYVGGDPDNPGYVHYGNVTYLDWSTSDGGGKVGLVDEDSNNFPVGGIQTVYNDLYVFGKEDQPCIAKLTGTSPSSYALPLLYQQSWTTHKTLIPAVNDLWFASRDGVDAFSGVQEYGDLRTFSYSDPIEDRFKSYWDTSGTVAGYYPKEGQYWLAFPGYHRIAISHTKIPSRMYSMSEEALLNRYPWAEYELYREELTNAATYKWVESSGTAGEYHVELLANGDPSIATPDAVIMDGKKLTKGTIGALADHEYAYGDNDSKGYNKVYIADEDGDPDTSGVVIRTVIIPHCFAAYGGTFYIGGSGGLVYKLDSTSTVYKDMDSIQFKPVWKSAYIEFPNVHRRITGYQQLATSQGGAGMYVKIYTNGIEETVAKSWEHNLPLSDLLKKGDMIMDKEDAKMAKGRQETIQWKNDFNIKARSFQIECSDVTLAGFPLYINGFIVNHKPLES